VKTRVLLREVKRVIFFPEYSPPRNDRGEHILKFTSEDGMYSETASMIALLTLGIDAKDFVDVIERLSITD
jgi:hypothetical protein